MRRDRASAVVRAGEHVWAVGSSTLDSLALSQAFVRCLRSSDGAETWTRTLDEPDRLEELTCLSLAPDGATLFVAGTSTSSQGPLSTELLVAALDAADGSVHWVRRLITAWGREARAFDVASSPDGSALYLTGQAKNKSYASATLVGAFESATGRTRWIAVDGVDEFLQDDTGGECVRPSLDGSLVLAAGLWDPGPTSDLQRELRAYDASTGNLLWVQRHEALPDPHGTRQRVLLDPSGECAFWASPSAKGPTLSAVELSAGAEIWQADLGEGTDQLVLRSDGQRLWALSRVPTAHPFDLDLQLASLDPTTGAALWTQDYDGGGNDLSFGLVPGASENALYALASCEQPQAALCVVAWESAGAGELFRLPLPATVPHDLVDLDGAGAGDQLVACGRRIEASGDTQARVVAIEGGQAALGWDDLYGTRSAGRHTLRAVELDARGGRSFAAGWTGVANKRALLVAQAPGSAQALWAIEAPGPAQSRFDALSLSPDGERVYAAGELGDQTWLQVRSAADGALLWEQTWATADQASIERIALSPDESRLYLAGRALTSPGSDASFLQERSASDSTLHWSVVDGALLFADEVLDLAAEEERVWILRQRGGQALAQAYASADGALIWSDAFLDPLTGSSADLLAHSFVLSADASRLFVLAASSGWAAQEPELALRQLDAASGTALSATSLALPGRRTRLSRPVVAPGGDRVYLGAVDSGVAGAAGREYVLAIDAHTGSLVWTHSAPPVSGASPEQALALDPSGLQLAHLTLVQRPGDADPGRDQHLRGYDAQTGQPLWEAWAEPETDARSADALSWAPDGRSLAWTGGVTSIATADVLRTRGLEFASLWAEVNALSLSQGGTQVLELAAGMPQARGEYLILGSSSGTRPGLPLGGGLLLPLALDRYTQLFLQGASASPVQGARGRLDAGGRARASLCVPAGSPPHLAGLELHHAYVVVQQGQGMQPGAWSFVSVPVSVRLEP